MINVIYFSYFNSNLNYYNITIFPENVNILLLNSINKVHPFLLYICLLIFILIFINFYNYIKNPTQISRVVLNHNILIVKHKVIISIYTLYLGSW